MTAVRRVVTGHTPAGEAIVVSDDEGAETTPANSPTTGPSPR